jgi:hypothetical protein
MDEQLKKYLVMQLNFLHRSAEAFDTGETDEAIRLAVTIRVLLHDSRSSTSILKRLKACDICLLSTCEPIPPDVVFSNGSMFFHGVVKTRQGLRAGVRASLGDGPPIRPRSLPSKNWWNQVVFVLSHGTDRRISRKDIVLTAANKDGGAHVDQGLTPQYENLKRLGGTWTSVEYKIGDEEKVIQFKNIHTVIIRQMSYELLNSPELLSLAN